MVTPAWTTIGALVASVFSDKQLQVWLLACQLVSWGWKQEARKEPMVSCSTDNCSSSVEPVAKITATGC